MAWRDVTSLTTSPRVSYADLAPQGSYLYLGIHLLLVHFGNSSRTSSLRAKLAKLLPKSYRPIVYQRGSRRCGDGGDGGITKAKTHELIFFLQLSIALQQRRGRSGAEVTTQASTWQRECPELVVHYDTNHGDASQLEAF